MTTCLGQLFWGLLLVILDFNINHFDILPNFVGYILVAIGTGGLVGVSPQFAIARNLSWILVPVSLVSMVPLGDLGAVVGLVHMVLNCGMMWFLLGGIVDVAASLKRPDLAEKASTRRIIYIALTCLATLAGLLAYVDRGIATVVGMPVIIAMLILVVMILHLIWKVREAVGVGTA